MDVRVLYVSRAVGPQTTTVTASILATARAYNREHGLSGVLCQGQGLYLQVLEGERGAINRLYAKIMRDRRHESIEMLSFEEIAKRRYPGWSMAHVHLDRADPMIELNHPEFDPYTASGAFVMRLVDELCAAGRAIDTPTDNP